MTIPDDETKAPYQDSRLRKLTPERRDAYLRIVRLRREIGSVAFDIVYELRSLRDA